MQFRTNGSVTDTVTDALYTKYITKSPYNTCNQNAPVSVTKKSVDQYLVACSKVAMAESAINAKVSVAITSASVKTEKWSAHRTWEGGSDVSSELDTLETTPNTKARFFEAAKEEISKISSIQHGLNSYSIAINSDYRHAFTKDFLENQTQAVLETVKQLSQISQNLQHVLLEAGIVEDGSNGVTTELKEAFSQAVSSVRRASAILVSCHIFHKVNYVLGSERLKSAF